MIDYLWCQIFDELNLIYFFLRARGRCLGL